MGQMKTICFGILFVVLVAAAGCLPTFEPVYTDEQLVFDDTLLGTWTQANTSNQWLVERGNAKSYLVSYREVGKPLARFEAHLCQIGDLLVLDLAPRADDPNVHPLQQLHQMPVHTIYLVTREPQKLTLAAIDFKWLEEYLLQHANELSSAKHSGRLVATGSTRDMQNFVTAHRDKFTNRMVLDRTPAR